MVAESEEWWQSLRSGSRVREVVGGSEEVSNTNILTFQIYIIIIRQYELDLTIRLSILLIRVALCAAGT